MNIVVIKNSIRDLLVSDANRYHLTLSPACGIKFNLLLDSLNTFIIYLNEKVYGKRFRSQGRYIRGLVVLEHEELCNPHFHFLIRDPDGDLEERISFEQAVFQVIKRIKFPLGRSVFKTNKLFVGLESYCLQKYYNDGEDSLEKYLSKEFYATSRLDNLAVLSPEGALFGEKDHKAYIPFSMLSERSLSARI